MNLDPREIARYLGIRGKALDPQGTAWADQCQRELAQTVTPRHLGRRLPLTLFQGQSRDLDYHLRHCREGILYAVTHGYLASIDVEKIPEFEKRLEEHMDNNHRPILEAIRTTGKLESDTETALKAALDELVAQLAS